MDTQMDSDGDMCQAGLVMDTQMDSDGDMCQAAEAQKRWDCIGPMGGMIDTCPSNLASEKALDDDSVGTKN